MNAPLSPLSPEARLVLLTAGGAACDAPIRALLRAPLDWARAGALAGAENALAPVWERVSAVGGDDLPPGAREHLQRGAWVAAFRQGWLEDRLDAALATLGEAGIRTVLLKGAAVARTVHAGFSARPMRDLDLLVPATEAERARRLLLAAGWRDGGEGEARPGHHHLPALEDGRGTGIGVELHTALFPAGHPFRLDAAELRARSVPLPGGKGARVPAHEDLVLHLALHFAWSHRVGSGAWRAFRDLSALVESGGVSWGAVVELARDARAASCCYWTLRLARTAAAVPVPPEALAALRPRAPEGWLALLERHFLAGLLPGGAECPSVRIERAAWHAAIRPGREGHGRVRPWDFDPPAPPQAGSLRRAWRRLAEVEGWRSYAFALLSKRAAFPLATEGSGEPPPARPALHAYPRVGADARGLPPGLRRARRGSVPTRSMVLVARAGEIDALPRAIRALSRVRAAGEELVVVAGAPRERVDPLRARHPGVRLVSVASTRTAAGLRAVGIEEAEGDVVRFREVGVSEGAPLRAGGDPPLRLSVVVAAHQDAERLPAALAALAASGFPREAWELVVVDDASTDGTSAAAARWADVVVRLPGPRRGGAYARNRGLEAAAGEVVVFLGPELRVRPDTLERLAAPFSDPEVGAVSGSLDPEGGGGTGGRFYHHLRHWEHRAAPPGAGVFWAGCCAVRRTAFLEAGGFDEWHYAGGDGEDLEFGRRLDAAGHRVHLAPDARVALGGSAGLGALLRGELARRTVPRAWLRHRAPATGGERRARGHFLAPAAAAAAIAALAAGALGRSPAALAVGLVAMAAAVAAGRPFYGFLTRSRGVAFAVRAAPLHLLFLCAEAAGAVAGRLLHALLGAPPAPPGVAARMGMDALPTWPPHPACPGASVWERPPSATENARLAVPRV